MGDQNPTHTGTEEVGEVLLHQPQQVVDAKKIGTSATIPSPAAHIEPLTGSEESYLCIGISLVLVGASQMTSPPEI